MDSRYMAPRRPPQGLRSFTQSTLLAHVRSLADSGGAVTVTEPSKGGSSYALQEPSRYVLVANIQRPTGHAEVLHLLFSRDEHKAALLRWEHITSKRTDFVCEFDTVDAAIRAVRHVRSFARIESRPQAAFLPRYTFVSFADSSEEVMEPTVGWIPFSTGQDIPPPIDTLTTANAWSVTPDGVPYKLHGRSTARREKSMPDVETPEALNKAIALIPSRPRSDRSWLLES